MIDSERWLEIILLFFFVSFLSSPSSSFGFFGGCLSAEWERKKRQGEKIGGFFWSKRCGTDTRKKNLGKRISERIAENMKWSVMNEINNDPVKGLGELWGKISKESPGLDRIFWKESSGKNLGGLSKNLEGEGGEMMMMMRKKKQQKQKKKQKKKKVEEEEESKFWILNWGMKATCNSDIKPRENGKHKWMESE